MKIGFNPAESEIIFSQGAVEGPGFYDIKTGELLRWFDDKNRTDRWVTCYSFAYSPNAEILAIGNHFFDAKKHKKELMFFSRFNRRPSTVMFSPDGGLFIEGGDSGEIIIRKAGPVRDFPAKAEWVE